MSIRFCSIDIVVNSIHVSANQLNLAGIALLNIWRVTRSGASRFRAGWRRQTFREPQLSSVLHYKRTYLLRCNQAKHKLGGRPCDSHDPIDEPTNMTSERRSGRSHGSIFNITEGMPSSRRFVNRHAPSVMPDDLDQVTAAAPKNVEITSVRIPLQALLNQTCKAPESAAHIGMARRKLHPHIARYGSNMNRHILPHRHILPNSTRIYYGQVPPFR
jgi:hypothetical protein